MNSPALTRRHSLGTFSCECEIRGTRAGQPVTLGLTNFVSSEGPLKSSAEVNLFGIGAHFAGRSQPANASPLWNGAKATFVRLEWI